MKTKHILISVLVLLNVSCTQKPISNNDLALVDSLATAMSDAFNSGDVNKVLSIYTDDAIFLNGLIKFSGRDSLASGFTTMVRYSKNFRFFPGVSSVTPDMIYMEGLFTFDWHMENAISNAKGVMTIVCRKQPDNSWKITYCEENHGDILKR